MLLNPSLIYVEQGLDQEARARKILQHFGKVPRLEIRHYGEVFNRNAQNFRLQKARPALILARKKGRMVLPAPANYTLGGQHNYYFSHMLNCLYDCRYCFLQGMYRSAHYVLFVNYADFANAVTQCCQQHRNESVHFFSGYDCDSLAMEPLTGFADFFIPVFEQLPDSLLELRTKSVQIRCLLKRKAIPNIVIAWSFTPAPIARALEYRTPSVEKRNLALRKLQRHEWKTSIHIDPLIWSPQYRQYYQALFQSLFSGMDMRYLHSVSLGSFRLPKSYFQKLYRMYPEEKLFAMAYSNGTGMIGFEPELEAEMIDWCTKQIQEHIPAEKLFPLQQHVSGYPNTESNIERTA